MALLSMGRSKEAYNMVWYWLTLQGDIMALPDEWPCLPKRDIRGNIFEDAPNLCINEGYQVKDATLIAALVAIKINFILDLEEKLVPTKGFDALTEKIEEQKRHLELYARKLEWFGLADLILNPG